MVRLSSSLKVIESDTDRIGYLWLPISDP